MSNFKQQSFLMPVHLNNCRLIGLHHKNKLFKLLRVIAVVLSFLFWQTAFSQEKINSLKKVLLSLKDSARVNCLNEISEAYIGLDLLKGYKQG